MLQGTIKQIPKFYVALLITILSLFDKCMIAYLVSKTLHLRSDTDTIIFF